MQRGCCEQFTEKIAEK